MSWRRGGKKRSKAAPGGRFGVGVVGVVVAAMAMAMVVVVLACGGVGGVRSGGIGGTSGQCREAETAVAARKPPPRKNTAEIGRMAEQAPFLGLQKDVRVRVFSFTVVCSPESLGGGVEAEADGHVLVLQVAVNRLGAAVHL